MRTLRLLFLLFACVGLLSAQEAKKKITRATDLPVFTYKIDGPVEDTLQSDEKFRALAAEMRKNVESVLANYDIEDKATRRSLLSVLANLDVLDGRDAEALKLLDEIRDLQEKPSAKIVSGVSLRAVLAAHASVKDRNSPEYRQTVYRNIRAALDAMPYEVVQNDIKGQKSSYEILGRDLLVGQVQAAMDEPLKKNGSLSSDLANALPTLRLALVEYVPLKATLTEAFSSYLAAHKIEKPDIWAARSVKLEPGKSYAPVTVAVWDSGVDSQIFKDRLAKDSSGKPDLIAYDLDSRKTTGELYPFTPEQQRKLPNLKQDVKGFSDLTANLDTPEASALKQKIAGLKPEQVKTFIEDLRLASNYMHGTHVAGILMDGNPYARLAIARISFDYKSVPDPCPSKELSQRSAAASQDYVDFFRRNHVRVVNMSWGGTAKEYEGGLELCGIGHSSEERQKMAREMFELEKAALIKAFQSAPEILFITAAGNDNGDSSFNEAIPSSIRLPNLITVGAVDRAGDEAPFTSYGPTVAVHANGFEVESYIPGGERIKFSGTSMASPNVANLAAKMLAVNPKLKPEQVIDLIRKTAETTPDGRRKLINPAKALEAAKPS